MTSPRGESSDQRETPGNRQALALPFLPAELEQGSPYRKLMVLTMSQVAASATCTYLVPSRGVRVYFEFTEVTHAADS